MDQKYLLDHNSGTCSGDHEEVRESLVVNIYTNDRVCSECPGTLLHFVNRRLLRFLQLVLEALRAATG